MRPLLLLLLLLFCFISFAADQERLNAIAKNPDSLLMVIKQELLTNSEPFDKAVKHHIMGLCYAKMGEPKLAISAYLTESELLTKYSKNNLKLEIENKLALSDSYYALGELITADSILQLSYLSVPKIKDYSLQISVLLKTGWMSRERGRHSEALGYYLEAQTIAEANNDEIQMAHTYARIAVVYHVMEDYKTAEQYYDLALDLYKKLGLKGEEGRLYNNYGLLYQNKKLEVKAIFYYEKSIDMCLEVGNKRGAAIAKENLGVVCFEYLRNNTLALDHFNYSLGVWRSMDDIYGQAQNLVYKVNVYIDQKNYQTVVDTALYSLELAKKSGAKDVERDALLQLVKGYEGLGEIEMAYTYFRRYFSLKDSLETINNFETINLMNQRHELQKVHVQDSLNMVIEYNQTQALTEAQYKEQRFWTMLLSIAFLALIVILFILIKGRREQVKSAKIIAETNTILKTKNREIIDSITYAKNIQNSILPTQEEIDQLFPENFLYYKPKDIVAGDFYWVHQQVTDNEIIKFVAVADCTGHGVPGAMVSIVCANAIHKSIVEMGLTKPSEILEEVNHIVNHNFGKGSQQLNDGMDICLLAIKPTANNEIEIQFAGANNPFWFIRKKTGILEEVKGTKRPVGKHIITIPFANNTFIFEKQDLLFLFTDGYADQFGGPREKKFNYKALKTLFEINQVESPTKQKEIYEMTLENWKADIEQIDDVCILGIKL